MDKTVKQMKDLLDKLNSDDEDFKKEFKKKVIDFEKKQEKMLEEERKNRNI